MMPGMGLTSIGLAGVVLAYAEIAHTFIDGMHALAGLTMFIGLIILAVGILDGGVSTSNRAKATVLVILSIALGFGAYAFTLNTVSTTATFAGVLLAIAAPAVVIAYVAMKHAQVLKPVSAIFALGSVAGIAAFVAFGTVGPSPYLFAQEADESAVEAPEPPGPAPLPEGLPETVVLMLEGSAVSGAPDYDPDGVTVGPGGVVTWINEDVAVHTATDKATAGAVFDTGLVAAGDSYSLLADDLEPGAYEYFCLVHPWMESVLTVSGGEGAGDAGAPPEAGAAVEPPAEPGAAGGPLGDAGAPPGDAGAPPGDAGAPTLRVSMPDGSSLPDPDKDFYVPPSADVEPGTLVVWSNDDIAAHTVTSGEPGVDVGSVFDSGVMASGATFERTFDEPGEYDYFCALHPWMTGSVSVS